MFKNTFGVLGASSSALSSMFIRGNALPARSWRAELTCRFVQNLFKRSLSQSDQWLRDSQSLLAMRGPALSKVVSKSYKIAGVNCLECVPKVDVQDVRSTIVYFHGGGYVIGSAQSYHYTVAKLAAMASARVIAVDYRLAPEHPLPAGQLDCLRVVETLLDTSSPQEHIFLAGDSAGAGLVLHTLRELKELGRSGAIDGAVLISPWVRPFDPEVLVTENESYDILSHAILDRWSSSLGDDHTASKRACDFSETSFIGFPPIYVQAAGKEMFKAQIDALVKRLRADRVVTSYDVFPDMFHVFQTLSPLVPEADRALALISKKIGQFI